MRIAIDLEGTLIPECAEFACERTNDLARRVLSVGLRRGAKALLRDLTRAGHTLTLYSSGKHTPGKLRLWCLLAGLPVHRIVTLSQTRKAARGTTHIVAWPPLYDQDIVLDDNPRHIAVAQRAGVPGVLVANNSDDWTACARYETLRGQGIELVSSPQLSQAQAA
jgi:hypothetical protein